MRSRTLLLVAALLVASCGSEGGATTVLREADTGSETSLTVGDRLEVELESNRTTGYSWEAAPLPDGLALVSSDFEQPSGSLVGAPGTQVFVFDVVAAGDSILRFEYIRPFDDPAIAEKIVEYVLTVAD